MLVLSSALFDWFWTFLVRFASLRPAQDIDADFACPLDLNEPPVVNVFECMLASLFDTLLPKFVLDVALLLLRLVLSWSSLFPCSWQSETLIITVSLLLLASSLFGVVTDVELNLVTFSPLVYLFYEVSF
jgi:hypothetical protein